MPGIFAQTIAFASATTAIGMTDDMRQGLIDRFRSCRCRSAVLSGRTVADTIYQARHPRGPHAGRTGRRLAGEQRTGGVLFAVVLLGFAHVMAWLGI